jgi:hypothetical protein
MRDGHNLTEISVVYKIGSHRTRRWSPDEDLEFLSMPRWNP